LLAVIREEFLLLAGNKSTQQGFWNPDVADNAHP
jgi:hypothetical protein